MMAVMEVLGIMDTIFKLITGLCLWAMIVWGLYRWRDTWKLLNDMGTALGKLFANYLRSSKTVVLVASAISVPELSADTRVPAEAPSAEAPASIVAHMPPSHLFMLFQEEPPLKYCTDGPANVPHCDFGDMAIGVWDCGSCLAAIAAAVVAWKAVSAIASILRIAKSLERILKIGAALTALREAVDVVIGRCGECRQNDCVQMFVKWANSVSTCTGEILSGWGNGLLELQDPGGPGLKPAP